jgi:hypothetical protein
MGKSNLFQLLARGGAGFEGVSAITHPKVEFGHKLSDLYGECSALGLVIGPDDRTQIENIVALLDSVNEASGLRYFMGPGALPDLAWTREVVGRLLDAVEPHVNSAEANQASGLGEVVGIRTIIGKRTSRGSKALDTSQPSLHSKTHLT